MFKRLIAVLALSIIGASIMVACDSDAKAPLLSQSEVSVHQVTPDEVFLNTLDENGIQYTSPGAAIALGHSVCDALDLNSPAAVVDAIVEGGLSPNEAVYVYKASVTSYCPGNNI